MMITGIAMHTPISVESQEEANCGGDGTLQIQMKLVLFLMQLKE